jgi:glutathione S-transferase
VQVPVLVDGELQITESPVVAEYVLRRYGAETGGRIACSCPDARKMAGAAARGCLQP